MKFRALVNCIMRAEPFRYRTNGSTSLFTFPYRTFSQQLQIIDDIDGPALYVVFRTRILASLCCAAAQFGRILRGPKSRKSRISPQDKARSHGCTQGTKEGAHQKPNENLWAILAFSSARLLPQVKWLVVKLITL